MSLFRDLGRRAERFRQQVVSAADAECADCGAAVPPDREACPDCGGEDLRRVD